MKPHLVSPVGTAMRPVAPSEVSISATSNVCWTARAVPPALWPSPTSTLSASSQSTPPSDSRPATHCSNTSSRTSRCTYAPTVSSSASEATSSLRLGEPERSDACELASSAVCGVYASRRNRRVWDRLMLTRGAREVERVLALTGASDVLEIGDLEAIGPLRWTPFPLGSRDTPG
jgi:hypothetical protein